MMWQRKQLIFLTAMSFLVGWLIGAIMVNTMITATDWQWFSLVEITPTKSPMTKARKLDLRKDSIIVLPMFDANDVRLMYPKYQVVMHLTELFSPQDIELGTVMFSDNKDITGKYNDISVIYCSKNH